MAADKRATSRWGEGSRGEHGGRFPEGFVWGAERRILKSSAHWYRDVIERNGG